MITQSYHIERDSMFSPGAFLGESKHICDTAIATFSHEIFKEVLSQYPHEEVAHLQELTFVKHFISEPEKYI